MSDTPVVRILPGNIQNLNETGLYLVGMISAPDVKALYESNADTNAYTDVDKGVVSSILSGARALDSITVIDDYQVLVDDFARQSLRINSTTLKTMTMPVMTEYYDGATLSFVILGTGDVKLLRSGANTMINETHVSITGTQQYSSIKIEYVHSITTWVVRETVGSWTGGVL